MMRDIDALALRRRAARALSSIAGYLGVTVPDPDADQANASIADWLDMLASVIEDALLSADPTLSETIATIDRRWQVGWPESCDPKSLLAHARRELAEIEQAMADADLRDSLRGEVVIECGDAMLLLARIALAYGATSGLQPLALAVRKTTRRLEHFERLVKSITPADAWRMAKQMAARG